MAKINVGIKFRPNLSSEVEKQEKWIVDGKTIKSVDNKHTLQFEHVFGSTAVTEEVYDALAKPIVKKAFKGYNGTIFAYGQTSSGKTHTMIGKNKMPGIIPLAVRDIFHEINETKDREFVVKIGYIEIYNDKVYDLFEDGKTELSIFESNGHVLVNQKEYVAVSEKEVMKQFAVGNKCKKMTGTKTNKDSNRSHTIFQITIKSQNKKAKDSRTSNLFLVDLAGSEKPDASATTTFNEGLHINQSLLVLGKIIRELAKKNSSLKRKAFKGFNGTIFAYGQTSSGKTHTMIGKNKMPGIIPLAVRDIFNEINKTEDREFVVKIGYIEIYNDKVYDLFEDGKTELSIFESNGHVLVNQKEYVAVSEKEVMKQFGVGNKCKKMTGTKTNKDSSRSHAIFRITITSQNKKKAKDSRTSNLFLVDLAGSEKPDASATTTFNEGLHINQSLLVLGKIIRELAKKNLSLKRVNFRECKLTRILSPALGGNSYASVICTAAPTVLDETYHTLCFAQNAEKVKTVPKFNLVSRTKFFFQACQMTVSSSSSSSSETNVAVDLNLERQLPLSPIAVPESSSGIPKKIKSKMYQKTSTKMLAVNSTPTVKASRKVTIKDEETLIEHRDGMKNRVEPLGLSGKKSVKEPADSQGVIQEGKDKIIKKLQEEVRKLKAENVEMRAEIEGNNEIVNEKQQEIEECRNKVVELEDDIKVYALAIRDLELAIREKESRMMKVGEEKNEMRSNFNEKFDEFKKILEVKDNEIVALKEKAKTKNVSTEAKKNEHLDNFLKTEQSFNLKYESAQKQLRITLSQLNDKIAIIKERDDEIELIRNKLNEFGNKEADKDTLTVDIVNKDNEGSSGSEGSTKNKETEDSAGSQGSSENKSSESEAESQKT
ncbi:CLUMA_CG001387, isoform A [Clunio marinus]|uniref:CLUMA_CG001387, isoform A n=1 Tax=Clunio marinus TaxID=568069 RepID=A0A1J1HMA9_9DIPT|nr:CLUMA_CG001387, isoform A [Clunio marinus]